MDAEHVHFMQSYRADACNADDRCLFLGFSLIRLFTCPVMFFLRFLKSN